MASILFIQDVLFEYFGPMYISSMLKKHGHECNLLVLSEEHDIYKEIARLSPDAVFVSCMTGPHKAYLKFLRELKERFTIPVLMGGPHPTFFPNVLNEDVVDFICVGEGERVAIDFADAIDAGSGVEQIPNIGWKNSRGECVINPIRSFIEDLDDLPFPDRQLYYTRYPSLANYPTKRFLATRGCPYNCTFCFNHAYKAMYHGKGRYLRHRSFDNIVEEMEQVRDSSRMRTVRFSDDSFTLDKNWLKGFLALYRQRIGIPFTCLVRANELDEETVEAFSRSACVNVFFGVESGNEGMRNTVLKKNLRNDQIIRAACLLKKYGIPFGTYNMLGLPGETLSNVIETIELNQLIGTDYPTATILQPYPGTELAEYVTASSHTDSSELANRIDGMISGSVLSADCAITNMNSFFYLACKYKGLLPIIKQLVKLPQNIFFELISFLSLAFVRLKSQNISLWEGVGLARRYFMKF